MSKILLIDNYDSFTYNLYHYLEELNEDGVDVMRNDEIDFEKANRFSRIVISPGSGLPKNAGALMKFLERFSGTKKIFGICLGLQAIAEHFEMNLLNLAEVVHGQSTKINVLKRDEGLFKDLPDNIKVGRYHSWVIDSKSFNSKFEISSVDDSGNIMSIKHKTLPIHAVQFHPESILTEYGKEIVSNWLKTT